MAEIPRFVQAYQKIDEPWFNKVKDIIEAAQEPGALDARTKTLIVLALDTMKGAAEGVRVVAAQAREMGITDQEIAEVMRLVYFVAGMDALKTGLNAFQD